MAEDLDHESENDSGDEYRDELPDDLDVTAITVPYEFPNNNRRRIPGVLYAVLGGLCIAVWAARSDTSALVNDGVLIAGIALCAFGAYSLVAGWNLVKDETDALVAATAAVGFPVGHASAQLGWRGLLSRPTWRILLYSNEAQPEKRGLVRVDGVSGDVIDHWVEDNPEDFSKL